MATPPVTPKVPTPPVAPTAPDVTPPTTPDVTPEQVAEQALTDEVRTLLTRHGLKRALVDRATGEVHFDEVHIQRLDADAYEEITAA
ncbi:MAG TPA: hypothetical protein VF690_01220 [Hymenobacter sp.]